MPVNVEHLRSLSRWIILFRDQYREGKLTQRSMEILGRGPDREKLTRAIRGVSDSAREFRSSLDTLLSRLGTDAPSLFGQDTDAIRLTRLGSRLRAWSGSSSTDLQIWVQYLETREQLRETFASPVLDALERGAIGPGDLIPCMVGNVADTLIRDSVRGRPVLSSFISQLHERKIEDFHNLDDDLIHLNRQRLVRKLYMRKPILGEALPAITPAPPPVRAPLGTHSSSAPSHGTGKRSSTPTATILDPADPALVFLRSEFNRKRGHRPIRVLLSRAGTLIQTIKPCFMMSPLSISQFLDPRSIRFDVVIFDEASQVRPGDALGALLRGNQVVVMGDTRQLPPTMFFDHMMDDPEAEYDDGARDSGTAPLSDMESLLHLCKCTFPTKYLTWHYRSRHESLIAVSNQQFYDDRMNVFPSSHARSENLGLQFVHLPDTVYDRGETAQNREEARAVADAALRHFRDHPGLTLGIATFSIRQRNAIQLEIERQLRGHPDLEEHFRRDTVEYFFVKHLETIQGDERDVIFISMGYGFDARRKLTLNFGPLNQDGGERRLNVLITRARRRCVVFSNFRGEDMRLGQDSPFGVRALKAYLEYAETGRIATRGGRTTSVHRPVPLTPGRRPAVLTSAMATAPPALTRSHTSGPPAPAGVTGSDSPAGSPATPVHDIAVLPEAISGGSPHVTPKAPEGSITSPSHSRPTMDPPHPILETLSRELLTHGYSVEPWVGCAGYRVELGVLDPLRPGRYILGIQTDGPGYASSPVARDRDRLRGIVLRQLGWDMYHVWSMDWYRERETVIASLLSRLGITGTGVGSGDAHGPPLRWQDAMADGDQGSPEAPGAAGTVSEPPSGDGARQTSRAGPVPPFPRGGKSMGLSSGLFRTVQRERRPDLDDRMMVAGITIPEYEVCTYLPIPVLGDLPDRSTEDLALAVAHVVGIEGPVHTDVVIKRIRSIWGLGHTGTRIKKALLRAVALAERQRSVYRKGTFLFSTNYYSPDWRVPVRRRGGEVPPEIDLIADDEIAEAVKLALREHDAIMENELISRTTRLLGFTATGSRITRRCRAVIVRLNNLEELDRSPEGVVTRRRTEIPSEQMP